MKLTIAIGIILLSLVSDAKAQNVDAKIAIGSYTVLSLIDLSQTEYALGKGNTVETNLIFARYTTRGPVTAGIAQGAGTVGISYVMWKIKDESKWIRWPAYIALNGFKFWVVAESNKHIRTLN